MAIVLKTIRVHIVTVSNTAVKSLIGLKDTNLCFSLCKCTCVRDCVFPLFTYADLKWQAPHTSLKLV